MATTRTIGPLHLEDLEPHRFEDLIRQLLYDFRPWRALEATGRSGADDGFDARGTEAISLDRTERDIGEDIDDGAADIGVTAERVWLVQCKREKAIGPKQLARYLDDITDPAALYGILFAAACDFSMAARNRFREKVREMGLAEAHLWGKGEIEDLLFQPKNDHLLFAYFGISLVTRRRALKTEVRAKLATKRKASRVLEQHRHRPVLLRDATDDRYPYADDDTGQHLLQRRRWTVMYYEGAFSEGLHFVLHRHPAYMGDDREEWDFAEKFDSGPVMSYENPWRLDKNDMEEVRAETFAIWEAFPEQNRAYFMVYAVLPYENILDIDDIGDEWFDKPHIYTTEFQLKKEPFCGFVESLEAINGRGQSLIARAMNPFPDGPPDPSKRVKKFLRRAE